MALGSGLINAKPDADGVIRSVPLVMRAGGKPRLGFAMEIARNALDAERVESTASSVKVGGRTVPIDHRGRMRLHFGEFPQDDIVSAARLLMKDEELPKDKFTGKTVLIGLSAQGTFDVAATPLAAESLGPLVHAQAVNSILRGGWLVRPAWAGAGRMGGRRFARIPCPGGRGPGQMVSLPPGSNLYCRTDCELVCIHGRRNLARSGEAAV